MTRLLLVLTNLALCPALLACSDTESAAGDLGANNLAPGGNGSGTGGGQTSTGFPETAGSSGGLPVAPGPSGGNPSQPAAPTGANAGQPATPAAGGASQLPPPAAGGNAGQPMTSAGGNAGQPATPAGGSAGQPATPAGGSAGQPATPAGGNAGQAMTSAEGGAGGTPEAGGAANPAPPATEGKSPDGLCPAGIMEEMSVASDGSGDFKSVGDAVASIPSGSTTPIRINVSAGTYKERLTIEERSNLCVVGENADNTILTFDSSEGTSTSASTLITANDFSAARLTFANSSPRGSGPAVAMLAHGERQQFLDSRFLGYQDTLYPRGGTQYFRGCYVEGTVDFIFGAATAIFEDCEVVKVGGGVAVVASRTPIDDPYGIIFLGGRFSEQSGGSTHLARPWRKDGMAMFIGVELDLEINSAGFTYMNGGGARNEPQNARFGEFGNTGKGSANGGRPDFALTEAEAAEYTVPNVLGPWVPSYSL